MSHRALMRDLVDLLCEFDTTAAELRTMATMATSELLSALEDRAERLEEAEAERLAEDFADQFRPDPVTGDLVHTQTSRED